jgi:hypothetical protein
MLNVVVVVSHLFCFVHLFSVLCTCFLFCALQLQFGVAGMIDERIAAGLGLTLDEPDSLSLEFSKNAWSESIFRTERHEHGSWTIMTATRTISQSSTEVRFTVTSTILNH